MTEKTIDIIGFEEEYRGFEEEERYRGFEEEEYRGIRRYLRAAKKPVIIEQVKNNLQEFLKKVDTLIAELPGFTKEYQIDTVEIQADISATGKVSLLGTGGEVASSGGIKFVLKKKI